MKKHKLSIVAAEQKKLQDISITDGQLIFVKDKGRIVLDLNGKRTFYNKINILETDEEREDYETDSTCFCFVKKTGILWFYDNQWVQVTGKEQCNLFKSYVLPSKGKDNELYVNMAERNISVWNTSSNEYVKVGETVEVISKDYIKNLFRQKGEE